MRTHRHRDCAQCGTAFQASRSDARFCSARCRKRHERGALQATAFRKVRSFLERNGFAHGEALTVSTATALAEFNAAVGRLQELGLRPVFQPLTEATFKSALRSAGLRVT